MTDPSPIIPRALVIGAGIGGMQAALDIANAGYDVVLAERKTQIAKTLSGGEQQMLAIGRAMMSEPRLLLIDEVSMGLMPILVKRVFGIINDLRQSGVSVLLMEQNAFEALKVVDRAYVLENGRLVLEGTAEELKENPRVKAAYLGG